jgi:hypothetical protein
MERTHVVRRLRITAALLCLAACAFLIVLWYRSYNHFDLIRGPLPNSRGFHICSSDGRLEVTEFRPPTAVHWQQSSVTLSQFDQIPQMQQLKKRYQMYQMSLTRSAERLPIKSSHDLDLQLEQANRDFEYIREELKQGLLRIWPVAPNTASPPRISITAGPVAQIHFGFGFQSSASGATFGVPFWFLILLSGACAAIIGLRRRLRFSLRTLLIAMTIAAIALGVFTRFYR